MARRATRTKSPGTQTIGERLVAMETRLEGTLNSLPSEIKAAILEAMREANQAMTAQLSEAFNRIAALERAQHFQAGSAKVQSANRTESMEWARTIFPYAFSVISGAVVVAWRALGHN